MMEAGPFSSRPARRFRLGLGGALLISLLLHVLLLVWMMFSGAADILLLPVGPAVAARERSPSSLQFTFVELPDDPGGRAECFRVYQTYCRGAMIDPDPESVKDAGQRFMVMELKK